MTRRALVRVSIRRRFRRLLSRLDHAVLDVATSAALVAAEHAVFRRANRRLRR